MDEPKINNTMVWFRSFLVTNTMFAVFNLLALVYLFTNVSPMVNDLRHLGEDAERNYEMVQKTHDQILVNQSELKQLAKTIQALSQHLDDSVKKVKVLRP